MNYRILGRTGLKVSEIGLGSEAFVGHDTAYGTDLVQQALHQLLRSGKTVLIVAHRISTIADADQILILDGGRIAERGTHEELLAKGGIYCKLNELQNRFQ